MSASEKLRELEKALQGEGQYVETVEQEAILGALPQLIAVVEAAEQAAAKQQQALAIIRDNGFVFDDIGSEPGNWKHLAFTLYTDLCEIDSHATPALTALSEALERK